VAYANVHTLQSRLLRHDPAGLGGSDGGGPRLKVRHANAIDPDLGPRTGDLVGRHECMLDPQGIQNLGRCAESRRHVGCQLKSARGFEEGDIRQGLRLTPSLERSQGPTGIKGPITVRHTDPTTVSTRCGAGIPGPEGIQQDDLMPHAPKMEGRPPAKGTGTHHHNAGRGSRP
jgi:hypothetical protein